MPAIFFICPVTGREVPSGIETDEHSFDSMTAQKITLLCPHCGKSHNWQMGEGHFWKFCPDLL